MTIWPFEKEEIRTVSEALVIAEDKTGDFYKFSFGQWKRHRYDVKTLLELKNREITPNAFALLKKCSRAISHFESKTKMMDFYFICLQDDQILEALKRDRRLDLLPLLIYIFTHELVHIIRFCNFSQRFDVSGQGKDEEERVVHTTTYEILKDLSIPKLDYILESYHGHRICEMFTS